MKLRSLLKGTPDPFATTISLRGLYEGHLKITYKGVPCLKCPMDYVIYQMIINETKPDLIIEIGTNNGGSAYYLADLLLFAGKGEIHTIDIDDRSHPSVKAHPKVKTFHNGWDNYDLDLAKPFQTVMVIEDSSHEYKNSLDAIERFAPLVSKGSYLIVEDGVVEALGMAEEFNGGPLKAVKEFLPKHPEFSIDTRWSDMFGKNATFNTAGYLKKA